VHVKLPFPETVFKSRVRRAKKNLLSVPVPAKVHLREFREFPRTDFSPRRRSLRFGIEHSPLPARTDRRSPGPRRGDLPPPLLGKIVWSRHLQTHELKSFGFCVGLKMLSAIPEVTIEKLPQPERLSHKSIS
jgi:hypothetical protein